MISAGSKHHNVSTVNKERIWSLLIWLMLRMTSNHKTVVVTSFIIVIGIYTTFEPSPS